MDVTKYNQVELGEYLRPKSWAKQRERKIYCFVEETGRIFINAEFSDGKSMWVSTETKAADIEINAAIFDLIKNTMEESPSEWYATTFTNVRTAIKLGADRVAKACSLEAYFEEEKYMDFAGVWHEYTSDTARNLAMQIFGMFAEDHADVSREKVKLLEIKDKLDSFSLEGSWQYNYGSISPYITELKKYKYLKINSNVLVRNLYMELEKRAEHLYNEYQSRVR